MESFSIGQLAKAAQVNVETVRYYERQGLLPKPARRLSGYRQYSTTSVARLKFIKNAKGMGFSLKEIAELLSLRVGAQHTCAEVKQRAAAKLADIQNKISDLRRMKKALVTLAEACQGDGPTSACPILDALQGTSPAVPDQVHAVAARSDRPCRAWN